FIFHSLSQGSASLHLGLWVLRPFGTFTIRPNAYTPIRPPLPYFRIVKYAVIFIFALLLASCSSKPIVTVVSQNGARAEWILVSVRDSSVVLLAPYEEIGRGIAFTHCVVMRSRDINRIAIHPKTDFFSRMPLALFGAGIGLA